MGLGIRQTWYSLSLWPGQATEPLRTTVFSSVNKNHKSYLAVLYRGLNVMLLEYYECSINSYCHWSFNEQRRTFKVKGKFWALIFLSSNGIPGNWKFFLYDMLSLESAADCLVQKCNSSLLHLHTHLQCDFAAPHIKEWTLFPPQIGTGLAPCFP